MSSLNWTHEIILDLIKCYRAKPVLWDATMKEYSDRNKRRDAWKYIGNVVGVTDIVLVGKKVRSLRTHFLSVHKDYLKKKRRSGCGSEEILKPKWFAYELLLFLTKGEKQRDTRDILIGVQDDGAITNDKERVDGKETEDDANLNDSSIAEESELKRSRSEQNKKIPFLHTRKHRNDKKKKKKLTWTNISMSLAPS
uniref:MADF domain-containing protein n=1 Tax=Timema cristinae TaxID=61476 RepID=A0A7R9DC79_TIMCR|nr:unnamed protein product [Timema cristinae]